MAQNIESSLWWNCNARRVEGWFWKSHWICYCDEYNIDMHSVQMGEARKWRKRKKVCAMGFIPFLVHCHEQYYIFDVRTLTATTEWWWHMLPVKSFFSWNGHDSWYGCMDGWDVSLTTLPLALSLSLSDHIYERETQRGTLAELFA